MIKKKKETAGFEPGLSQLAKPPPLMAESGANWPAPGARFASQSATAPPSTLPSSTGDAVPSFWSAPPPFQPAHWLKLARWVAGGRSGRKPHRPLETSIENSLPRCGNVKARKPGGANWRATLPLFPLSRRGFLARHNVASWHALSLNPAVISNKNEMWNTASRPLTFPFQDPSSPRLSNDFKHLIIIVLLAVAFLLPGSGSTPSGGGGTGQAGCGGGGGRGNGKQSPSNWSLHRERLDEIGHRSLRYSSQVANWDGGDGSKKVEQGR